MNSYFSKAALASVLLTFIGCGTQQSGSTLHLAVRTNQKIESIWPEEIRHKVTYCVSKAFGNDYEGVVDHLDAAISEWQKYGDVQYTHDSTFDLDCSADSPVTFDVTPLGTAGMKSFFPHQERRTRRFQVGLLSLKKPEVEIINDFLHEIGHTLGFIHEHVRNPLAKDELACGQIGEWQEITAYDSSSIMHYVSCPGGSGAKTGLLSQLDQMGMTEIYGAAPAVREESCSTQSSDGCF